MVIFRYVNVYQRVRDKSPFWVLTSYRFYSVMVAAVLKQYFSVLGFGDIILPPWQRFATPRHSLMSQKSHQPQGPGTLEATAPLR